MLRKNQDGILAREGTLVERILLGVSVVDDSTSKTMGGEI